eukprot:TRINITY_DN10536_c0_g2_i1.p2 TRINITY_DN10536_c0_g2~~TRINITY_DN10536_c0_g2_i1.p2  ORF type:complete len:289 (+),score=42.54 TRINITY_DN10536_c0_g2_i1:2059-2925(+)
MLTMNLMMAQRIACVCGLAFLTVALAGGIDPRHAINITLYHINELEYPADDILNMDVADVFGDLYFDLRTRAIPYECAADPHSQDCTNPETVNTSNIGVTEVIVTVDNRFTNYSRCDIDNTTGKYACVCYPHETCNTSVGREDVAAAHKPMRPPVWGSDWEWWKYNLAQLFGGFWYSTTDTGACSQTSQDAPCTWQLVEVHKRVHKRCSDQLLNSVVYQHNQSCFDACPQPTNSSTQCFSQCFFNTVLGPQYSSRNYDPSTATMDKNIFSKTFQQAFMDVSEGGCPEV